MAGSITLNLSYRNPGTDALESNPVGPSSDTDRTQLAYYFNAESSTVGTAAPNFFQYNSSVISNDRAFAGTKSIKTPIVSGSETNGGSAFLYDYITSAPVKGDTTWFSMRIWAPLNATWVGSPGYIKWFRYRMAEPFAPAPDSAIYTLLAADGSLFSNYEGFPDNANYLKVGAGNGPTLGAWTTFEHCVVWDNVSKDGGGSGEQRFYRNGTQLWRRTDQKTLLTATAEVETFGWIDFWNGGASFSGDVYVDDMTIAVKRAGRDDTEYMATDANGRKFIGL